jgi:hypothetical protein
VAAEASGLRADGVESLFEELEVLEHPILFAAADRRRVAVGCVAMVQCESDVTAQFEVVK